MARTRQFLAFWLTNVLRATAACQFSRSQLQKWLRACGVLHILTYKYASRHSGVPFLRIRTSKISAALRCFVHFDLQMCFSPQRRAIFANRNVQNGSEHAVFCTFWLTNVLLATAACHFCKSQRPKLVPHWGVLCILTYKCTSRHSGVPFLQIATSKMAPALRCFVHFDLQMCFSPQRRAIFPHRNFQNGSAPEVFCTFRHTNVLRATAACHFSYRGSAATSAPEATFRSAGTTNHWKNTAIRDIANIWRVCICFLVTLLAWWSSFYWLDCCATLLFNCPYCRKLDF